MGWPRAALRCAFLHPAPPRPALPHASQVVHRSGALLRYGPAFRFDEGVFATGPLMGLVLAAGMALVVACLALRPLHPLLRLLGHRPGHGPSYETQVLRGEAGGAGGGCCTGGSSHTAGSAGSTPPAPLLLCPLLARMPTPVPLQMKGFYNYVSVGEIDEASGQRPNRVFATFGASARCALAASLSCLALSSDAR